MINIVIKILFGLLTVPVLCCTLIIEIKKEGHDEPSCLDSAVQSRPACLTLDYVFNGGIGVKSGTEVHIYSGRYPLKRNTEFKKLENIRLIGKGKTGSVEIFCRWPNIGFSFQRSSDIQISNIVMSSCGVRRNESLSSAVHFVFCKNLHISMSEFKRSLGKGVSMFDVGGTVVFSNVTFANNTEAESTGGIYAEFTTCGAFDPVGCSSQMEQQKYIHKSNYSFLLCHFLSNKLVLKNNLSNKLEDSSEKTFLKGGGIGIVFRGNASSNNFMMKRCLFKDNLATWGGGLTVEMFDKCSNNIFVFEDTYFIRNSANFAGGGIDIGMLFYNKHSFQKDNLLTFVRCIFFSNRAIWGGGVSVRGTTRLLKNPQEKHLEALSFTQCTFVANYATVGAAFGLSTDNLNMNPVGSGTSYGVKFSGCAIIDNGIIWTEDKKVIGQGAVYGEEFLLVLSETRFISNEGTALILDSASATIIGNVSFIGNTGLKGGALGMYSNSWLLLKAGANLTFKLNHAYEKGGAMYVHGAGPSRLAFRTTDLLLCKCFLRYGNDDELDPDSWNATVYFINNTAPEAGGNSVFANTLQMCRLKNEPRKGNRALTWKSIKYVSSGNGFPEIATEAIEIFMKINQWHASPLVPFMPDLQLFDERNNSVYGTVMVNITSKGDKVSLRNPVYLVKDKIPFIRLDGRENSKFNISVITTDGQAVMTDMKTQSLGRCPPGFYQKQNDECKCLDNETGITRCEKYEVYVLKGYWLGFDNKNMTITKPCPLHFCKDCSPKDKLNYECKYIPGKMCSENRTGVLCSVCKQGCSVKLGSEDCSPCRDIYLLLIIPMLFAAMAFVLVVMYFNFDAFSGYLNAYLYAYQSLSLVIVESVSLDPFIGIVIGITCLSGTGNTLGLCFFDGFQSIHKLGFNLAVPLFILLILGLLCVALPQKIWYRIFGGSTRMNSFGRAFSFVYVFCYTALTSKTLDLLHPIEINGKLYVFKAASVPFFGRQHLPFAIPALLVLIVFVIGFPVILIFTPFFSSRFSIVSRMMPAINSLKNCFKSPFLGRNMPDYQYFSIFYFVCRFILLLFNIFMEEETSRLVLFSILCVFFLVIFTWCQPYLLQSFNFWDTLILTNLCLISLINVILSVPYVLTPVYQKLAVYSVRVLVYVPLVTVIFRLIAYVHRKRLLRRNRSVRYEPQQDVQDAPPRASLGVPFLGRKKRMRPSKIPKRLTENEPSEISEVLEM
eukprot:gene6924-7702_t